MQLDSTQRDAVPTATFAVAASSATSIAPVTGASSTTRPYYHPELDVLRAVAFLLVFVSHVLPPTSPDSFSWMHAFGEFSTAGVCLFFTLSAFLITELLLREQEATGSIHVQAFYARRVLRIWPLYFLAILLGAIVPHLAHRPTNLPAVLYPYLLFCGNWAILLHGAWYSNPLVMPLWSISVEEQFYLVWPALVRRWARPGILFASLLVLPVGWITDFTLPALHYVRDPMLWINSFSQFQFFGVGALLALATHHRRFAPGPWLRVAALVGSGVGFFLSAYPFHFNDGGPGSTPTHVLLGYLSLDAACALLFCCLLNQKLPGACRPLIYLGKISYGLYVYHFLFVVACNDYFVKKLHLASFPAVAATSTVAMAATTIVASFSYMWFEKPFLRLKNRFTLIPSRGA